MRLLILFVLYCSSLVATNNIITKQTQLSAKRDGLGGIQVADQFYFAGGFELNDYIPTNIVEIYNITSGEWEEPIYLEEPRGFISTAVIGQNIYFIGGTRVLYCTALYNSSSHQYEDIGCGPTVRKIPVQITNQNATVTILGSFSVDFYNITSKQWYYFPKLTSWMQNISSGFSLIHENLIIGVGGFNATTLDLINDAWIYDTYTDELTVFSNAITTLNTVNKSFKFTVANGRVGIYTTDDRFISHQFGTTEWREVFVNNILQAAILPDVLFLVNDTSYAVYDWNTEALTFTLDRIYNIYQFGSQLVLHRLTSLRIYEAGQWTELQLASSMYTSARWLNRIVFRGAGNQLPFYDSLTKSIWTSSSTAPFNIVSFLPFDDDRLVIFMSGQLATIYYASNDSLSAVFAANMTSGVVVGTDIISLDSQTVLINLTQVMPLTRMTTSASSDYTVLRGYLSDYNYIDVYNYVTRSWQPQIFMNLTQQIGVNYPNIVVIDDLLIVMKRFGYFRYNTTTGEIVTLNTAVGAPFFRTLNRVPIVDRIGYLPGSAPSAMISFNSTSLTFVDTLSLPERTNQFTTSPENVIYMSANSQGVFSKIFIYNISSGMLDTAVLPSPPSSAFVATVNNVTLAFGTGGDIFGFYHSDPSKWYTTPFNYSISPTIIEIVADGTLMLASGRHYQLGFYNDQILFVNASAIIALASVVSEPVTGTEPTYNVPLDSPSGLATGDLVAAIVVPVVVVIGGVIALVIVLVKRRRNNKKKGSSNTVGLEARFGAWFTPFDQITFGEQLGQGASGQVFKGTWKNTTVALKVSMTQANTSVIAELELMMQLRPHPNVVQLLGFSVHPETDSIILIIEFCEGGSLDAKLYDETHEISFKDQVQWLVGVAKGLSHLHSNNIVHRDIAARNVLIDRNEPKLTDFGMSRLVDEQKQHGTTKSELGPIRWMSPESLKNKEYSTKSDVWSFGILMFEVIARQEPHSEADPIEIGRLIRDSGLTPVIPSSCHPQLADVMKQCWQMSPQSRPTIEAIIPELEAVRISLH